MSDLCICGHTESDHSTIASNITWHACEHCTGAQCPGFRLAIAQKDAQP